MNRWRGSIMNWRNVGSLLLLALPAFGAWMALDGLLSGPNYFGSRVVIIEDTTSETTTSQGGRYGAPSSSSILWVNYHYTDAQGRIRQGRTWVAPDKIPPDERKPEHQMFIKVAVDRGCKPEPQKIPALQIEPGQKRVRVDHFAAAVECVVPIRQDGPTGSRLMRSIFSAATTSPGCRSAIMRRSEKP
jgi:hypothetical protein